MKLEFLNLLRCPKCKIELKLRNAVYDTETERTINREDGENIKDIKEGELICKNTCVYKIKNYIPRFVESDSYVESFSYEWNKHRLTQFDSHNKDYASEKNFTNFLGGDLQKLKNKLILDAGCGSGRYAEIAAKYGSKVICVDLSYSINFAKENLSQCKNVYFVQADIFNLPFANASFDAIYSLGVLHHTPDAQKGFNELCRILKNEGIISIFVYANYNKALVYSSEFWRKITTKISSEFLYHLSFVSIPLYYVYKIPVLGHFLRVTFPISMEKNPMVRALDTFDWYSPKYQSKHTHNEVAKWFEHNKLEIIRVPEGEVSMLGRKK